jgi:hypothetical protein
MAHTVATWNAATVNVAYTPGYADASSIAFTGFGEDTIVSLEQIGDSFEESEGADGLVDRTNRNAKSYNLTVTLKQVSPTNVALVDAHMAEKEDTDGTVGSITVTGIDGSKKLSGTAWIKTPARMDAARKMSMREWKFVVTEVAFN